MARPISCGDAPPRPGSDVADGWIEHPFRHQLGNGTDWSIAGVGDFDSDGKADILWRRASEAGSNVADG